MLVDATLFGDNQVFDGGTAQGFSVSFVANLVANIVHHHGGPFVPVVYNPMRRGEVETQIVAEGEGWELLDWRPEFALEDLVDTVLSYKDHVLH
jgi:nucleoside-diphosphate-sugar epimerase